MDRLTRFKRSITLSEQVVLSMAHTISLGAALLLLVLAVLFLFLIGPLALLILIVVVVLLWYAFGPGSRRVRISS